MFRTRFHARADRPKSPSDLLSVSHFQDALIAWILLIAINCYNLYTFYYEALLTGKGYVTRAQQINMLGQAVYLALAIGLIYAGFGLTAIVASQLISTVIRRILTYRVFFTPELKTNMTTGQLYLLSLEVPVKLIGYDMQKLRLPADGTYSDQTAPDGQMVLAVDFDANLQLYLKTIHDAPAPEPTASEEAIS